MTIRPEEEFEQKTLDLIKREFGLGGLARFIMTCRSAKGDYTAERHQWLDRLTIDEIVADIKRLESNPPRNVANQPVRQDHPHRPSRSAPPAEAPSVKLLDLESATK